MDYKKIYDSLCSSRKYRGIEKGDGFEVHHIIPRSCGGLDEDSNLVKLTYAEHFIAHKLLTKFYTGANRLKMLSSMVLMSCHGRLKYSKHFNSAKYVKVNIRSVSLFNFFCENDINPIMVSLNFNCNDLPFDDELKSIFEGKSKTEVRNELKVLSKLVIALKSNVIHKSEYFAITPNRSRHNSSLERILYILERNGFVERVTSPEKFPRIFLINGKLKMLCQQCEETCREIYISSANTFDKKLHKMLSMLDTKLMVCKSPKRNSYVVYPLSMRDILHISNTIVDIVGKRISWSELNVLVNSVGYSNSIDNCNIVKEK